MQLVAVLNTRSKLGIRLLVEILKIAREFEEYLTNLFFYNSYDES